MGKPWCKGKTMMQKVKEILHPSQAMFHNRHIKSMQPWWAHLPWTNPDNDNQESHKTQASPRTTKSSFHVNSIKLPKNYKVPFLHWDSEQWNWFIGIQSVLLFFNFGSDKSIENWVLWFILNFLWDYFSLMNLVTDFTS